MTKWVYSPTSLNTIYKWIAAKQNAFLFSNLQASYHPGKSISSAWWEITVFFLNGIFLSETKVPQEQTADCASASTGLKMRILSRVSAAPHHFLSHPHTEAADLLLIRVSSRVGEQWLGTQIAHSPWTSVKGTCGPRPGIKFALRKSPWDVKCPQEQMGTLLLPGLVPKTLLHAEVNH